MSKAEKILVEKEKQAEAAVMDMENSEYGIKELIQGILIGIIIGFALAWILLK